MNDSRIDPVIFSVLKARVDGIINQTSDVLMWTSRNPILYAAKDFTCGLFDHKGQLLSMTNSIPVHIGGLRGSLQAIIEAYKDDLHPGDVFANNSPYHGANHYGDWSMAAPIFFEGELVGWSANLCHIIDCGAHKPTNLDPYATNIYEEGLHFPPTRFLKEYKEVRDIIQLVKTNFRYPEQWHGDFLAQVGALYTGAREVEKLCGKYGPKLMKDFWDELVDFGDRRMTEEIKKMPKGTFRIEDISEKFEDLAPDGVEMVVTLKIDPDNAMLTFDLTEMGDQREWGYNLTPQTAKGPCIFGTLACLDPSIPRSDGVYKHFDLKLREGAACGIPRWPAGTSAATIGLCDELAALVYRLWESAIPGMGIAGGGEHSPTQAVCSGVDFRRNNEPYGHVTYIAMAGGPALKGNDGWAAWLHNGALGNQALESVELTELSTPFLIWDVGVIPDSGGVGKWRGAVGHYHRIQPRKHNMRIITFGTGVNHPPRGVAGGKDGKLARHWVEKHGTGAFVQELKNAENSLIWEDEEWVAYAQGGGGYGDPLERDPEQVRFDARNGFISLEAAEKMYGVVLNTKSELYEVDYEATEKLREKMKKG